MSLIYAAAPEPPERRENEMTTTHLQVWHARVRAEDVEQLLALWPAGMAEAQRLCPDLVRADLVRLEDGTWLDVLTWSCPDGEEWLMRHADQFDAVNKMHALLEDVSQVGRGEIVLTSP